MTFSVVCFIGSSGASTPEELVSFSDELFHRNNSVGAWCYNVEMGIGNNAHG